MDDFELMLLRVNDLERPYEFLRRHKSYSKQLEKVQELFKEVVLRCL